MYLEYYVRDRRVPIGCSVHSNGGRRNKGRCPEATAVRLDRFNRPQALNRGTELFPEGPELLRLTMSWQRRNIETGLEYPQTVRAEQAGPDKRK